MEPLLSVQQAARLLGLSPRTIYNFAGQQRIPVQRVGRRVMFRPSALEAWLNEQSEPVGKPFLTKRRRSHVQPEEA
jgi:excisionase family DNA binding protein